MPSSEEIKKRIDRFTETCREAGVKLTQQRLEIFKEVAGTESHPDAETIFRHVRKKMPTISMDTVYRTMWLLNDLGLVNTVRSTGKRIRFDANTDPHHHFVCTKCGATIDFDCDSCSGVEVPDTVKKLGSVATAHLEFRGLCSRCLGKNKK
jgi:Fur family transcriptional regulator, peroxide stress response regulator